MADFPVVPAPTALVNVDMQNCFVHGTRSQHQTDLPCRIGSTGWPRRVVSQLGIGRHLETSAERLFNGHFNFVQNRCSNSERVVIGLAGSGEQLAKEETCLVPADNNVCHF